MKFVHTNVYSEFSLLSSTNRMEKLVEQASMLGYEALALTDHHVMYGAVPFYKACLKFQIKPLIGLEVTIFDENRRESFLLRLLAKSNDGYRSLNKLSTILGLKESKRAYLLKEELLRYTEACLIIIPYYEGPLEAYLKSREQTNAGQWLSSWFSSDFIDKKDVYLELSGEMDQDESYHRQLVSIAEQGGWNCLAGHPVRYLQKEDVSSYVVLKAIQSGQLMERIELKPYEKKAFLLSKDELKQISSIMSAYQSMEEMINKSEVALSFEESLMPKFPLQDGQTAENTLRELCLQGLKKRYKNPSEEAYSRLDYELNVINSMGFTDYFLVVWDFIRYAKEHGILVGPGRGSAASSLVAFTLAITEIDPLKYNLLFERFLNPERQSLPDIDVDFPDHRREEVIQYVQKSYGKNYVAQILTFGTFAAKAAIRDVGKVLGLHAFEIEKAAKLVPSRPGITLEKAISSNEEFRNFLKESEELEQLKHLALKIEGLPRHSSTHAAGVIISQKPLTDIVALQSGQDGVYLTQATMGVLEEVGFVKFDFLGLRNLTMLERVQDAVHAHTGEKIDLLQLPLDDVKVYEELSKGETTGVFQLESDGMRGVLRQLKPSKFEDIVAVNALYRPGPMDFIPTYIQGKNEPDHTVTYLHPDLEPILSSTYGVIVYQEQIIQIAVKLARYSLAEADILRRAISKKNKKTLQAEKAGFINRSMELGYTKEMAERIFDLIERFANYGFPRSHAVAYSFISYQLAYVKVHYPAAFYAALFSGVLHQKEKMIDYIQEAKRTKVPLLPPSLEKSDIRFSLEEDGIRMGFLSVDHIGYQVAAFLVESRNQELPDNLFDFCVKMDSKLINKKVVESLIKSGALDYFKQDRAVLLASVDEAFEYAQKVHDFKEEMDGLFTLSLDPPQYLEQEPLSELEKLEYEHEVLGFYLSGHPVLQYERVFETYKRETIDDVLNHSPHITRIAALVLESKQIKTKKGDQMAFVEMSDETNRVDAVIFPSVWKNNSPLFKQGQLLFLEGKVDQSRNKSQFIVNKVMNLTHLLQKQKRLFIRIPKEQNEKGILEKITEILRPFYGETPVIIFDEAREQKIQLNFFINKESQAIAILKDLLGDENVVIGE
ncbi:DNA polymerase III subunit alpha [Alkalihalobacillus sp. 1P02AB]|uniref:DNA polymerase III subunit alpha n=1 Tax=Alkalihalobacillus sp. 1P02AB TaxID=3132260 RepID=UPI0039A4C135